MDEDEREELIRKLLAEFQDSTGATDDGTKYAFIAGARAMAYAMENPDQTTDAAR
jgi:hypothetical protein